MDAEAVAARYARALAHIVGVLGPERVCTCMLPEDCGLQEEADEALSTAKAALAGREF